MSKFYFIVSWFVGFTGDAKVDFRFSDLQLNLTAGEELEIEYEVDGWFYVSNSYWIL